MAFKINILAKIILSLRLISFYVFLFSVLAIFIYLLFNRLKNRMWRLPRIWIYFSLCAIVVFLSSSALMRFVPEKYFYEMTADGNIVYESDILDSPPTAVPDLSESDKSSPTNNPTPAPTEDPLVINECPHDKRNFGMKYSLNKNKCVALVIPCKYQDITPAYRVEYPKGWKVEGYGGPGRHTEKVTNKGGQSIAITNIGSGNELNKLKDILFDFDNWTQHYTLPAGTMFVSSTFINIGDNRVLKLVTSDSIYYYLAASPDNTVFEFHISKTSNSASFIKELKNIINSLEIIPNLSVESC